MKIYFIAQQSRQRGILDDILPVHTRLTLTLLHTPLTLRPPFSQTVHTHTLPTPIHIAPLLFTYIPSHSPHFLSTTYIHSFYSPVSHTPFLFHNHPHNLSPTCLSAHKNTSSTKFLSSWMEL